MHEQYREAGGSRSQYVQFTREDFEDWLGDVTPSGKRWKRAPGTEGVYLIPLSNKVGVKVNSSMTGRGDVVTYAQGSMNMSLVSLLTGKVLNKKAQGRSHFKRTKNWRLTMAKAVDTFEKTYKDSRGFYDALAELEPGRAGQAKYEADIKAMIERFPGWKTDDTLVQYWQRVDTGGVLLPFQRKELENYQLPEQSEGARRRQPEQPSVPSVDDALLERIRKLWYVANKNGDNWMMDFAKSVGTQYKTRGRLSDKQKAVLEKGFQRYRIASVIRAPF